MSRLYRCPVCGYESHEHTTCPNCMAQTLAGLPPGARHTPHNKPKTTHSAMLDELAAALKSAPPPATPEVPPLEVAEAPPPETWEAPTSSSPPEA